jgi:uncharacterized membrane protein
MKEMVVTLVFLMFASLAWPQTPGYTIRQITYPGSDETAVLAINDRRDVIGWHNHWDAGISGYFTKWGARYRDLIMESPCFGMTPTAVNNRRVIVGYSCEGYAFAQADKKRKEIINAPGAHFTQVYGVNDRGDVVGAAYRDGWWIPFLRQGETFSDLPPADGWEVWPKDINNKGQIVGTAHEQATGRTLGFLLDGGEYDFFEMPEGAYGWVGGLNDRGHVVGAFFRVEFEDPIVGQCCWRGWLLKDGQYTIIDVGVQTSPTGINNAGHIAGTFYRPDDDWASHGFVAVPKPVKVVKR